MQPQMPDLLVTSASRARHRDIMSYRSVKDYLYKTASKPAKGPLAMIFVEDEVEVGTTLRHHLERLSCASWAPPGSRWPR